MNKIFLFICVLFYSLNIKAQFPQPLPQGNTLQEWYQRGAVGSATGYHFLTNYSDTAAANSASYISGIPNFLIVVNGVLYKRNAAATKWETSTAGSGWLLAGNADTNPLLNFIGTTDSVDFVGKTKEIEQIRLLASGGISIPSSTGSSTGVIFKGSNRFIHSFQLPGTATTVGGNLFIGIKSGNFTMTGSVGGFGTRNTAVGDSTLFGNTTGYRNVAIGTWAGAANTSGFENTIVGANASQKSTSRQNTAIGAISMTNTTTGERNVAVGFSTLEGNQTGSRNTAIGGRAMQNTVSSFANVAVGFDALSYTVAGDHNVGIGLDALYFSDGTHNVALGDSTLWGLFGLGIKHVGYKNVAVGSRAGYHLGDTYPNFASIYDTACIFLGGNASRDSSIPYTTSLQNMVVIGYNARGSASNQVVLGNNDITTTLLKGNVGLGTTTPAEKLEVVGGSILGRWKARVGSTTSSATPTINTDNVDIYKLTAQAAAITSFTTNLSGTPVDGDILEIQITDDGTARAITWGASFVSSSVILPTTTTISTTLTVIFQYYTTSSYGNNKWVCVNYY